MLTTQLKQLQQRLTAFQVKLSLRQIKAILASNKPLFGNGNRKLGRKILTFGIPAVTTCPGRTEVCAGGECPRCYATKLFYTYKNSIDFKIRNLVWSLSKDFVAKIVGDLNYLRPRVIRIHDAGDFYGADYVRKWLSVARRLPAHHFYGYTRSWRVPRLVPGLEGLAARPNVRLFYSVDNSSGRPPAVPSRVRLAWLQTDARDFPDYAVDLVFRDYGLRSTIAKTTAGVLVCPHENGVPETSQYFNCGDCGLCWDTRTDAKDPRRHRRNEPATRRIPLRIL